VLSLGYSEGPKDQMSYDTLLNQSRLGFNELIMDMNIALEVGFKPYITSRDGILVSGKLLCLRG
jgi:hypothetical protein